MSPRPSATSPSLPLAIGKTLDQPVLISTAYGGVPPVLLGGAVLVGIVAVARAPRGQKRKVFWKTLSVLTGTVLSALLAVRGLKVSGKQILPGLLTVASRRDAIAKQTALIETFLERDGEGDSIPEASRRILVDGKSKIFGVSQVRTLYSELGSTAEGKAFLDELIPLEKPDSHEIRGEIRRLSLLGLVPVLGGLAGGVLGDLLTESDWRARAPDKIKEGFYQYLANIFLCNIGAWLGLVAVEKAHVDSAGARAAAMTGGILGVGVLGGSAIANYLGNKLIDPLFPNTRGKDAKLYAERRPELIDLITHLDDLPVIGFLAGWKLVGPLLPLLYSLSGYRVGIGYRNVEEEARTF